MKSDRAISAFILFRCSLKTCTSIGTTYIIGTEAQPLKDILSCFRISLKESTNKACQNFIPLTRTTTFCGDAEQLRLSDVDHETDEGDLQEQLRRDACRWKMFNVALADRVVFFQARLGLSPFVLRVEMRTTQSWDNNGKETLS